MSKLGTMLQVGRTFGMRDGMLRLEYELQRGSGLMSWKMRPMEGWKAWKLERIVPGAAAEDLLASRRDERARFFFRDVRDLRNGLTEILGSEGEKQIHEEAERIVRGNLPFFGELKYFCGAPPKWFENPVTRQRVSPQQRWTHMRFASPAYGDLKFILEPSRFLFVYPLVRAYALSGDERFAEFFWSAVEDWARCSAPVSGPLWICGQECSLRILAWSFGLHGFLHSPATTPKRVSLLYSMIAAHAWRTGQTLDYARSQRSNHLISEAVGLWTAGTLYPELSDAGAWRNLGAQVLRDAVMDQITPEGVSHQHSFNYQRMILHLLLWTMRLSEVADVPLRAEIRERTEAAFDFLRGWVDETSGCVPNFGADDGSLIFPLATAGYRDYRPLVQLGASVLGREGLPCGAWDEEALWFGSKSEIAETRSVSRSIQVRTEAANETGYFRLGDKESWAMIRAGKYERRPYQADQLHVDLWWKGINLARDAGTYLYNGPAPWNNAFAGTAVHNTVMVDDDQMRRAGRFLWLDWAQASGRLFHATGSKAGIANRFEGEHDGYERIGVTHRRNVQWLGDAGWIVIDDLEGAGEHELRLHWLTPDFAYAVSNCANDERRLQTPQLAAQPFQVSFETPESKVRWFIFASDAARRAIVRGGKVVEGCSAATDSVTQLLGWEAKTYGDLHPAISLICEARARVPFRFVTVVLTNGGWRVEWSKNQVSVFESDSAARSNEAPKFRVSLLPDCSGPVRDLSSAESSENASREMAPDRRGGKQL